MLVLLADGWTNGWSTMNLFCVYRSSWRDPLGYIRLFGHVLGHANWEHFLNNMLLLLVVGPPMEEKYGSIPLLKDFSFPDQTAHAFCDFLDRNGFVEAM